MTILVPAVVKQMRTFTEHPNQSADIKRIGFMKGQIQVPDDFDDMGKTEITNLFRLE